MIAGTSCSNLRGERIEGAFVRGGGDRSLGDIGQRGVSRISGLVEGFWGTGAFIVESELEGCRVGVDAADNARCVAAAEGGLEVTERAGLTS